MWGSDEERMSLVAEARADVSQDTNETSQIGTWVRKDELGR